jgi:hypothetical protein
MINERTGHVLGATYFCTYWRLNYTVTDIHENGFVTVQWDADGTRRARSTTHCTHVGRDKQVA